MVTIPRTATFTWSPSELFLAAGTVSGALDATFSNESQLEIWAPFDADVHQAVKATLTVPERFNRLAWGRGGKDDDKKWPSGVIAAGMDKGELCVYDPVKIFDQKNAEESLVFKNNTHNGPVRALDFNTQQPHLLASGSTNGEIYIWDLNNPQKVHSPGSRSKHLEDITCLAWNPLVNHVLATSSNNGSTVAWDVRGHKEIFPLSYEHVRGAVSAFCWQPDNPTRLITSTEDDANPILMVWDLRNSRVPEKVLKGHSKGILGMDWCKEDPELLVSSGKDGRTLLWNPNTGQLVGELPSSSNWSFQVQWCPQNPNYVATASFDQTICIHSLQATNQGANADTQARSNQAADIFDSSAVHDTSIQPHPISLSQPPKWLKRPSSVSFGFGGKLAIVEKQEASAAAAAAPSQQQQAPATSSKSVIRIQQVVTETEIVERAVTLENAIENQSLTDYCAQKVVQSKSDENNKQMKENSSFHDDHATWVLLRSLFGADSKDELVALLGYSKADIKQKVEEAARNFRFMRPEYSRFSSQSGINKNTQERGSPSSGSLEVEDSVSVAKEPLVTFAQQQVGANSGSDGEATTGRITPTELTPSEISTSVVSDGTRLAEAESEVTEPSLFSEDRNNEPNSSTGAEFFDQIRSSNAGILESAAGQSRIASSVVATAGSAPSSVSSELAPKAPTFKIYPNDESETDRLVTKALVVGDFESAVSMCISSDRFADAILLAVRGGPELLARAQKAYFDRQSSTMPYIRLFQSIVSHDLLDIVHNAHLSDWQEIFVILCTFSKPDEFAVLVEQLGHRLEQQYALSSSVDNFSSSTMTSPSAIDYRKDAVVCYLAAGKLEKVVGIWIDEMKEDEECFLKNNSGTTLKDKHASRYGNRAHALQTFIEKVIVFQNAVGYVDTDADLTTATDPKEFKLAQLYDCYFEYAELISSQGLLSSATKIVARIPKLYQQLVGKDKLLVTNQQTQQQQQRPAAVNNRTQQYPSRHGYMPSSGSASYPSNSYAPPVAQNVYEQANVRSAYEPVHTNTYEPPSVHSAYEPNPYEPVQHAYQPSVATPAAPSVVSPSSSRQIPPPPPPPHNVHQQQSQFAPPPPPRSATPSSPRRSSEKGGWNDAPMTISASRRSATPSGHRLNPITSPFPNAAPGIPGVQQPPSSHTGQYPPPPPRTPSSATYPHGAQMHAPPPPVPPVPQSIPPPPGPPQPINRPPQQQVQPPQMHMQPQQVHHMQQQHAPGQPPIHQQPPMQQMPMSLPHQQVPPQRMAAASPPVQQQPQVKAEPVPKYPPGDRSHIPEAHRPIFEILRNKLEGLKRVCPPNQKRMVDDTEKRINLLFDKLNYETIDSNTIPQLLEIAKAIEAKDQATAVRIHLNLLQTGGSEPYMPALKVLASRCANI